MAQCIHAVAIAGNHGAANFVLGGASLLAIRESLTSSGVVAYDLAASAIWPCNLADRSENGPCLRDSSSRPCPGGTLGDGAWNRLGSWVGHGFENRLGAVRSVGKQDGQRGLHGLETKVGWAGMAVDPVKKSREIEEFVAHFDKLKVKEFLLARHELRFGD